MAANFKQPLRRPAGKTSNSRQPLRRTAGKTSNSRQPLRRPAGKTSNSRQPLRRPAAAKTSTQVAKQPASKGSSDTSSFGPDRSDQSAKAKYDFSGFCYKIWFQNVIEGRLSLESSPEWVYAVEAAKFLNRKIKCSGCPKLYEHHELSYRQWSPHSWTGYCHNCYNR
jgi:hypothetical protein